MPSEPTPIKTKACPRCGAQFDIFEGDAEPYSCDRCSNPYLNTLDSQGQLALKWGQNRTHTRDNF